MNRCHCDNAVVMLVILLIENNGILLKWVATPFWSDSIVFDKSNITSVTTALTLMLSVNEPLVELSSTHFLIDIAFAS